MEIYFAHDISLPKSPPRCWLMSSSVHQCSQLLTLSTIYWYFSVGAATARNAQACQRGSRGNASFASSRAVGPHKMAHTALSFSALGKSAWPIKHCQLRNSQVYLVQEVQKLYFIIHQTHEQFLELNSSVPSFTLYKFMSGFVACH